ncbi:MULTISPECIES: hypothetical protein [Rhodococcus]|jgi:hypothetical protein|uniref:Uncharacterized protein n=1 Tax=Rhodococcus oxybenzonivorans TaxID=1990687 RepID=A0AAE5A5Y0_9NOCA|nr:MULTISPECIES: hypothetical protein [Rhodococcus]MDV7243381.1 hypothetical protein [Rhodococcus oxybenzonivorans]MDV7263919.1 hypothetical protein [Rhodococcus oxybenzonivorans]MDV7276807.1 hypothetical protein [Rhodococcus oxybenzonivorans]MDV7334359.1 hypothetical protein [Rhodococcus oxybenzonivorans]MDV7344514.1 hypothetical protein [Rhodococcus oxybenzonivorans]
MPVIILHAAIAFAMLLTPRRVAETIQRMLTNIAVAQATARWLAMAASENQEDSGHDPLRDGPAEPNVATQ